MSAASNLLIVDVIPQGATYLGGGTRVANTVQWTLPSLTGYGATTPVTFTVYANTTVTNTLYSLTASGGASAIGSPAVTTQIVDAQTTLRSLEASSLHYADAEDATDIQMPGGAVFEDTVIAYRELPAPTQPLPASWRCTFGRAINGRPRA